MKRLVLIIPDGMADRPLPNAGGKTPLEMAKIPNMDRLAAGAVTGMVSSIPYGFPPGSDVAIMSLLGHDPRKYYTGRAPLEAAGMGIALKDEDTAWRCNLIHLDPDDTGPLPSHRMGSYSAGHITTDEGRAVIQSIQEKLGIPDRRFYGGVGYRHLLVWRHGPREVLTTPPHDIPNQPVKPHLPKGPRSQEVISIMESAREVLFNLPVNSDRRKRGELPANAIWLWGSGTRPRLPTIQDRHGITAGIITAVDLVRGLGILSGFQPIDVPGATGYLDTDYEGKAQAALEFLADHPMIVVHIESPDEAGHGGQLEDKIRAIEDVDQRFLQPFLHGLETLGPYRLLLLPDHRTPIEVRTHTSEAVPFLLFDTEETVVGPTLFSEKEAASTGISYPSGPALFDLFVKKGGQS